MSPFARKLLVGDGTSAVSDWISFLDLLPNLVSISPIRPSRMLRYALFSLSHRDSSVVFVPLCHDNTVLKQFTFIQ